MATLVRLKMEIDDIVQNTYTLKNKTEEDRQKEFVSTLKVQSWFRGVRTRSYLNYLGDCAIAIQRRWRGFIGRKYYRILVKNHVFIMKLNHYNAMTVKIQKVWKGFYVRKYVFNYYSRKRYLEGLQLKNEIIRSELADYAEHLVMVEKARADRLTQMKQELWSRKHHYLLSTQVREGIYNNPYMQYADIREYMLRDAKPLSHKKVVSKEEPYDPTCKSYALPGPTVLPPIGKKPQGPFRDPRDVQKQRYKPFQPTLKVMTNFLSMEEAREKMKMDEWVTRLNDNIFIPFTRRQRPYDPLLHTTSNYGHLSYGTKYFREEQIDKLVRQDTFKTLVPPIPIFEKLNDTYSQGQV